MGWLDGMRVLVAGAGGSGLATARVLAANGARVPVTDEPAMWLAVTGTKVAVGNAGDPWSMRLLTASPAARKAPITLGEPSGGQLGVLNGGLVDLAFTGGAVLAATGERQVRRPPGPAGVTDALAAAALALAAASLRGYEQVVWIAGGVLGGARVDELVEANAARLAGVVLIGADRAVFMTALARHAPDVPVRQVKSRDDDAMAEAVRIAADLAQPGDVVLLAPAAASMDMFTDYAHRGRAFAAAARAVADWVRSR